MTKISATSLRRAIIVCALGYFIDVFDIQLFAVLRVPSLTELGVAADRLTAISGYIFNAQMLGMIIGAFMWGWLGDRFGRLKALYGSILIYSLGTLACSMVHDPVTYGVLRFATGFGLAGETGAATALVAEMMSPQKRGWGITIIGGFGYLGPVFATLASMFLPWRMTYVFAGVMGLLLLVLRMKLSEPQLFQKMNQNKNRHNPLKLFARPKQALTLVYCVIIGLPFVYSWNILNFFSMELSRAVLKDGEIFNQKICLMLFYFGASCGDIFSGTISQLWRSRRKAVAAFLIAGICINGTYLMAGPHIRMTAEALYGTYFLIGLAGGAWILFTTIAAEHFGTNVRATAAITVVNFVRGSNIPLIFAFQWFHGFASITDAAALTGVFLYPLAFFALRQLRETHGVDLDYIEDVK